MKEFIHNKIQIIEELFAEFNKVQKLYSVKSFDFKQEFSVFLHRVAEFFRDRGESNKESEVLRVINLLQTVKRGFNPSKLEKITNNRREQWWGFAFNGIETLESILQEIYKKETIKLDEGEELIFNVLLSLTQNGLLPDEKLNELNSIPKIEQFWEQLLSQNGSMTLVNRRLLAHLIAEDIYLIIEKVINKITKR